MKRFVAPLVIVAMLAPAVALAGPAEDKGLEIANEADRRDEGFGDSRSNMVMVLRNKRGQESKRELEIRTLEVKGDGDKSMTVFHTPRDVRGTALLTFSHPVDADEQWLYLPALRRVKRIASNNKSGPFMGSEFAYEDFASQEVEKYTYKYLKVRKSTASTVFSSSSIRLARIPDTPGFKLGSTRANTEFRRSTSTTARGLC